MDREQVAVSDGEVELFHSRPRAEVIRDTMSDGDEGTIIVPVIEEVITVGKAVEEIGRVRIIRTVREEEPVVDEPLLREQVEVARVPVNRLLEVGETVTARQEGELFIVPVLEEVAVVEKRLLLREELHISRRQTQYHAPETVVVRAQEVTVERDVLPKALNGESVPETT